MSWIGLKLKPIAPMPWRPAFSKVGGLPHATQIGGWLAPYGFGSTLWGVSIEKCSPWNV